MASQPKTSAPNERLHKDQLRSLPPKERLKKLSDFSAINLGNQPLIRIYKSGPQLVKVADEYLKNENYEEAYMNYMKFMTIFLEKVGQHPDRKNLPPAILTDNRNSLRKVISEAEKLKEKLLEIYSKEHEMYLLKKDEEERKKKEKEELERIEQFEKLQQEGKEKKQPPYREPEHSISHSVVKRSTIKSVPYIPDDFLKYEFPENTENKPSAPSITKPGVDRSTKPQTINKDGYQKSLRNIIIPSSIITTFLKLAQPNTNKNIETCGILAGKMASSQFVITHLLIPKQEATSDSCTTDNEEDLFSYQDEFNLLTLGWIHTHPSQTAFLSSVDLHTHYSYQLMLSEAIAIVCAPSYEEIRFFRLTPNYGLNFIANCRESGFHPHPSEPPLFQDAEHCIVSDTAKLQVEDFR